MTKLITEQVDGLTKKWVKLPYFSQLDNYDSAGYTCNSSMCWSLACFARPELIAKYGPNGDYSYYYKQLVEPYGDTTDHSNQTAALDYLKVKTVWRTDCSLVELAKHIEDKAQPVGLGILHNGAIADQQAYGLTGGHMVTAHGTYRDSAGKLVALVISDPNGELDLVSGGYAGMPVAGYDLKYSYTNLSRRFECDSNGRYMPGMGWARLLVA